MCIRKDGATRRSAPFAVETTDWSHAQEGYFDLIDLDGEQPIMGHTGQLDGLAQHDPEERDQESS
eukprot:7210601-Prorocentrum_lima.AAC.1